MRGKKHYDLNALREAWDDDDTWMTVGDIICNVGPWIMIVMVLAMIISAI